MAMGGGRREGEQPTIDDDVNRHRPFVVMTALMYGWMVGGVVGELQS